MKIIHTSDLHLGSPLSTKLKSDKLRERKRERLSNFTRLCEEAKRVGAAAIIIAGDMFDSQKISLRALDYTIDVIEKNKDISFFYLAGNHEKSAVKDSGRALPENLFLFGDDWTYYAIGDVVIAGRCEISDNIFDTLTLEDNKKNIVVLHGELRDRTKAPDAIGIKDAAERNIDYLALGHYHTHSAKKIDRRGVAVYSGTPEGRGFDEIGEMGYVLIDTDEAEARCYFVPFAKRQIHVVRVSADSLVRHSELSERVEDALRGIPYEHLVRLEITGKRKLGFWIDTLSLERQFEKRFYYFEIKDTTTLEINADDYANDRSLKGEFIRLVMAENNLSEEEKDKIILCGLNALLGEGEL